VVRMGNYSAQPKIWPQSGFSTMCITIQHITENSL
jgi:hypothetical protein